MYRQESSCLRSQCWSQSDITFLFRSSPKRCKRQSYSSWRDRCEQRCSCTNIWSEQSWKKIFLQWKSQRKLMMNRRTMRLFFYQVFIWKTVQMIIDYMKPFLNKDEASRKELTENVHHILARSRWWSNEDCNRIKLFVPVHDSFHRVFGNGTVQEQIFQLLWISSKWLTEEFKRDILKVIRESDQDYYYKEGVFRK